MKAEKFKELFGCDEPIKNWETESGMFDPPNRTISEFLYQKMILEIEKKTPDISNATAEIVRDLAVENSELKRGIDNIYVFISEAKKGRTNISIQSNYYMFRAIHSELHRNIDVIKNYWVK